MNKQLLDMLNATEQQLIRKTESTALADLDEDRLADLHDRVRRARNKYSKLYLRRARAQVGSDATRAKAHAQHARTAAKAEIFEDALARVSTQLARAARSSARGLRDERLAAARTGGSSRPATKKAGARRSTTGSRRAEKKRRTPVSSRSRAATRASNARRQAKRDSR